LEARARANAGKALQQLLQRGVDPRIAQIAAERLLADALARLSERKKGKKKPRSSKKTITTT
jgi:hypothetical protein